MTLALLASAQLLADDVDAWGMPRLRALLPVAGMTVIEQQAERARSVGAAALLLLVDGVPAPLAEACDRIRSRGLPVQLVRGGNDVIAAAVAVGADRLLLAADGLVAGELPWKAAAAPRAAMLVTADGHATQAFERIDAATRWAGLAVLPQSALAALADAPPDWDPQLLLLRRAVQEDAPRIDWDDGAFVSGDIVLAASAVAATAAEARLMGETQRSEGGIGSRWVLGPLVRLVAGPLLSAQASSSVARGGTIVAAIAGAGAALAGLPLVAIALGVVAALTHCAADFVAGFRPESRALRWASGAGWALQFGAFALVERGVTAGSIDDWTGSGTMAATLMVAAGAVVGPRRSGWPLLDLPAAWLLMALLLPPLGRETAALAIGGIGLALLALSDRFAPWQAQRRLPVA